MTIEPGIYLDTFKAYEGGKQNLYITEVEADGGSNGFRICGPKIYPTASYHAYRHRLTQDDMKTIKKYLNKVVKYDLMDTGV